MKNKIVISAINIFEGGALSILDDCLNYLNSELYQEYEIIALVHDKTKFSLPNVKFLEFKNSRKSYLYRLFYEYIWFYFLSIKIKPYLWFSLHDITPNVKSNICAVYCHNPSPFYKISIQEFKFEPSFGLFNLFYKYLYAINLNKNKFIVVQQNWLREEFKNKLKAKSNILVAPPNVTSNKVEIDVKSNEIGKFIFFFPSLPRVFKNVECVCEATKILNARGLNFELHLTIAGNENKYAKHLYLKYGAVNNIKFLGQIKRNEVFDKFKICSALVFPSKLETWGLPITEAKLFNKPILLADSPYAHETVGNYSKVSFFQPDNNFELAELMNQIINNSIIYDGNVAKEINSPIAYNWKEVFTILLD